MKDFNCIAQNTALFVDLLKNIFSASIGKLKRVEPQKLMKNYQVTQFNFYLISYCGMNVSFYVSLKLKRSYLSKRKILNKKILHLCKICVFIMSTFI